MKPYLFNLFFLFSSWSITQTTPDNKEMRISFSVDYSNLVFYINNSSNTENINNDFFPKPGLTLDFGARLKKSNQLSLTAGLRLANLGTETRTIIDPNVMYIINVNGANSITSTYNYNYLSIPFGIQWFLNKKGLKVSLISEANVNTFLLGHYNHSLYDESGAFLRKIRTSINHSERFKNAKLGVLLGLGFNYEIKNGLKIAIEPVYRKHISFFKSKGLKYDFYSFGINWGIYKSIS